MNISKYNYPNILLAQNRIRRDRDMPLLASFEIRWHKKTLLEAEKHFKHFRNLRGAAWHSCCFEWIAKLCIATGL